MQPRHAAALAVLVLSGCAVAPPTARPPVDLAIDADTAGGRTLLLPDGTLRRGDAGAPASALRLVRVLDPAQIERLWNDVEGLPAAPDAEDGPIVVHAGGTRRVLVGDAADALAARLAALAWADEDAAPRLPPPRRYDFGPDPYARYRR